MSSRTLRRSLNAARRIERLLQRPIFYRGNRVECPVCGGRFRSFAPGPGGRSGVRCPSCNSLERHRALWLYLAGETDLFRNPQSVLHIAPESALSRKLADVHGDGYLSGDLNPRFAMEAIDLTAVDKPADSFDAVIVSHVLEHIPDDLKAIGEIGRILRPGGVALLQHPIDFARSTTYEDRSVTDEREREERFGQRDHVRVYGRDFPVRLRRGGLQAERIDLGDFVPPRVQERFGLADGQPGIRRGDIYRCAPL